MHYCLILLFTSTSTLPLTIAQTGQYVSSESFNALATSSSEALPAVINISIKIDLKPVGCSFLRIPFIVIENPLISFFILLSSVSTDDPRHEPRLRSSSSRDVYPRLSPRGGVYSIDTGTLVSTTPLKCNRSFNNVSDACSSSALLIL